MANTKAPWHSGPWPTIRRRILHRDNHTCQIRTPGICTHTATHVDHIRSPLNGGAWFDQHNLRAACQPCNLARPQPTRRQPQPSRNW